MRRILCIAALFMTAVPAYAAGADSDPFQGRIYQAIATAIVFVVVLVVLKKAAWGKILQGLQDRENKIRQDLEQAESAAKQADSTLKEYQAKLAEAQAEARQIIDQGRTDAQKISQQIKDDAQRDLTQMRQRAQDEIRTDKEQALNEIYAQTASLSTQIAGRILEREISPNDHAQLVQSALGELNEVTKN